MARILFVWEQGANIGHLNNLRLPIEIAVKDGHQVILAARELHAVKSIIGDLPITCMQAPFKQNAVMLGQEAFLSYTHVLSRQCFSNADELQVYLNAWCALFYLVKPDLVVFEHSPTALIAAHDYQFKKLLVGNGFSIPPQGQSPDAPFTAFPTTQLTPAALETLHSDDVALLKMINTVLTLIGAKPMGSLHRIYGQAHARLLTTWPQLDHFGERPGQLYLGVKPPPPLAPAEWPSGSGPKVFGYLNAMPSLELFLQGLVSAQVCALLLVRNLPKPLRDRYGSDRIRFIDNAVNLDDVARQVSWVVNNCNHNTVAFFAQRGVPQLLIPTYQEHLFLALRLVHKGAAAMAYQDQPAYGAAINTMLSHAPLRQQAKLLASQMTPYDMLGAEKHIRKTFEKTLAT